MTEYESEEKERTKNRWGAVAVASAPVLFAATLFAHPWIGSPGDEGFLTALAAAVEGDTARWVVSHLGVGFASGFVALAFIALRAYLRDAGDGTWSAIGLPFVVFASVLFAMLPAMEMAPVAAADAGGDVAATQAALEPYFVPIHLTSGILFLLGTLAFARGLTATRVLGTSATWVVVGALIVMGASRIVPVSVVLLYVGPVAGLVALWPLAVAMWRHPVVRPAAGPRAAQAA